MSKEGGSDSSIISEKSVGMNPNKSGSTMNTAISKGNSMQVYNETD